MSKIYHDFPEHIKALKTKNASLRFDMRNMEGEVQFLRNHLKDLISDIMAEGNYTVTFPETKINDMWHELGLWHEVMAEVDDG